MLAASGERREIFFRCFENGEMNFLTSHILLGDGVIVTFTSTNRTENDDDAFDVWQIEYASTQCSIVGDEIPIHFQSR